MVRDIEKKKLVNFRSHLLGEIVTFCGSEGITCVKTAESIVQLVSSLVHYREEGYSLFPKVFICSDFKTLYSIIKGSEKVDIGEGDISENTIKTALKRCAPLAVGGWSIFLERSESGFRYGLFSACTLPLSLSPYEILYEGDGPTFNVIIASQVSDDIIELWGNTGNQLQIHFSPIKENSSSPVQAIEKFSYAITKDVKKEIRKNAYRYVNHFLRSYMLRSHGTLAVAITKGHKKPPKIMRSGVIFTEPFSIADKIEKYEKLKNDEAMANLSETTKLVEGMLMCDGITVFKSDCSIIAYNVILKSSFENREKKTILGGARHQAFAKLSEKVPSELIAAFIRSQDGNMECRCKDHD